MAAKAGLDKTFPLFAIIKLVFEKRRKIRTGPALVKNDATESSFTSTSHAALSSVSVAIYCCKRCCSGLVCAIACKHQLPQQHNISSRVVFISMNIFKNWQMACRKNRQ